jgi:hypothetical protein
MARSRGLGDVYKRQELAGQIVYQDMELAEAMQAGMHSRGYRDAYLSDQETRIRFFHEVLNDWIEGRQGRA